MSGRQPRIAMLSVHSSPMGKPGAKDTGGMSTYIREVALELANQYKVDIYTRAYDPQNPEVEELHPNVRLIHLRAGEDKEMHKLLMYSYMPDFACNVENFRKRHQIDYELIFSHYWLSGLVGQTLERWWHVPHITMFHTVAAIKNALGIGEDEPELRLEAEAGLARNCDRIISATEREKNKLVFYYAAPPEKISVIPCGVNLDLFRPLDKQAAKRGLGLGDSRIILFVGRIEHLKGIDNLLKAMPYLKDSKPRLVIIGGDENSRDEMERLQRLARQLNVEDSVIFSGLVEYEKMPDFYSAADVCVIPSYYESFGLVALESLACGTPIVATDVGDFKNIIQPGKTGYVVTDNAPTNLASKIALVLSRPSPDAEAIRASVARFGWRNIAQALAREFESVLNEYSLKRTPACFQAVIHAHLHGHHEVPKHPLL